MKKIIPLLLALVLCLPLCACGGEAEPNVPETTEQTKPLTAREQLTEREEKLFRCIVAMATDVFFESSAVRVLEVCDYEERTIYKDSGPDSYDYKYLYGPDTVVVRLQGENKLSSIINQYFLVCITSAENKSEYAQTMINNSDNEYVHYKEKRMEFKAEAGEFAGLSVHYEANEDASDLFNIGRINKALKEYWEEMGF